MVATKYPYQKSVDLNRLDQEIKTNPVITIAIDHLHAPSPGNVDIWFKDVLPTNQKTELDTVVTDHVNEPLPQEIIQVTRILEQSEDSQKRTDGRFQMTTLDFDIPAGSAGDVTVFDYTFPIPVSILGAQFLSLTTHIGDEIDFDVAPNTTIGVVTQDVSTANTVIRVSQTVLDNTFVGAFLRITDGTNTNNLNRVIAVGYDNGQGFEADLVKVATATVNSFAAATPTYVQQTVKFVYSFKVPAANRIEIGETKIGSSYVPANVVLRTTYKNNNGEAKNFGAIIEYFY